MFHDRLSNRFSLVGALALTLGLAPNLASADTSPNKGRKDPRTCASAHKSAQEREQAGQLVEATKQFLKCAATACGESLSQECAARNIELFSKLPTVVVVASDSTGEPLVDVEVKVDGQVLTSRLDGLALAIDPGPHEFTFAAGSTVLPSQKITIVSGERNRPIMVTEEGGKQREPTGPLSSAEPLR